MVRPRSPGWFALGLVYCTLLACARGAGDAGAGSSEATGIEEVDGGAIAAVLERQVARIDSAARVADSIFQPLPLLTPAQENELRSFGNAAQLEHARRLGIQRGSGSEALAALQGEGRLVRLGDSEHWIVGDLDYSQPLVVPAVHDLLTDLGERFQERLAELGAPLFRVEVSSVLRSAADQAILRTVNPNAAAGESTHEYGTTVDVLYSAFAAPAEPIVGIDSAGAPSVAGLIERYAEISAERVAARRAMELKAILGAVLLELQREGRVMVTLERQQPVFHMTVAEAR